VLVEDACRRGLLLEMFSSFEVWQLEKFAVLKFAVLKPGSSEAWQLERFAVLNNPQLERFVSRKLDD